MSIGFLTFFYINQEEKTLLNSKYLNQMKNTENTIKTLINMKKARQEAQTLLNETNARIENTIRQIKEAQAEKEKTKEVRKELEDYKTRINVQNSVNSSASNTVQRHTGDKTA